MNDKHLIWTNPHAPAKATTPRRRRSKLMFQDERQQINEADTEQDLSEYKLRRADKRGIKS